LFLFLFFPDSPMFCDVDCCCVFLILFSIFFLEGSVRPQPFFTFFFPCFLNVVSPPPPLWAGTFVCDLPPHPPFWTFCDPFVFFCSSNVVFFRGFFHFFLALPRFFFQCFLVGRPPRCIQVSFITFFFFVELFRTWSPFLFPGVALSLFFPCL